MAWSDYWTPIRYGVAAVAGLTIAAVSYLALVSDEYVTVDAYAEVLLGTVERCQATATAGPTITTNTTTNVTAGYASDPSGRCWGGTNVYLVPVYETNVVTAILTNWTYAAAPPAVVTVERITVGRIISGYQTNYHDSNGVWHTSPPENPSTNAVPWTNIVSIYTNDSPAVLTNTLTNAVTAYIPAGAIQTLQAAAEAAVPYYLNTRQTAPPFDAWTVTGIFAHCGFPAGWDTNAGPNYVAATNFAQLYAVLSRLTDTAAANVSASRYFTRYGYAIKTNDLAGAQYEAALEFVSSLYTNAGGDTPAIYRSETFHNAATNGYPAGTVVDIVWALSRSIQAEVDTDFSDEFAEGAAVSFWLQVVTNKPINASEATGTDQWDFDAHNSGFALGWNLGSRVLIVPSQGVHTSAVMGANPYPGSFQMTWPDTPSGKVYRRGYAYGHIYGPLNVQATRGFLFYYCTNAP